MELLEILLVVGFSVMATSAGIYVYRQRRKPGMKQSASMENLQSNDLTVATEY